MDMEQVEVIKIILVGAGTTGKSWMLQQFMKKKVNNNSQPTIGVEFATKNIQIKDITNETQLKTVKLQIWDTAGQERYQSITQAHYRKSKGAILVYNITKQESLKKTLDQIELIKQTADPNCVLMLVGNYLDLVEDNPASRAISLDVARSIASENNMIFMEVSAKNGKNIEEIFTQLATKILQNIEQQQQQIEAKLC